MEKIWAKNCARGEKMTNMRYAVQLYRWGGRKLGEELPLREVKCKRVRIAKLQAKATEEKDNDGEEATGQNGPEDDILGELFIS